jgi:hypothetical protein
MGSERPPRTRDELLDHVYGRARQLWWQRRVAPVVAASIVLVGLVSAPVLFRDGAGKPRKVAAIDQPTTTTEVEETTTTLLPGLDESTSTTAVIVAPPTTARAETTLVCRNSYDPKCGPFRWDPDPGPNAPLTVKVTFSPSNPTAGDTVQIHVVTDDPDAPTLSGWGCSPKFGDQTGVQCVTGLCAPQDEPHGPWTPPPRRPLHHEETFSHAYEDAGTYNFEIDRVSSEGDCRWPPNPYGSGGKGTATIVVSPAPA